MSGSPLRTPVSGSRNDVRTQTTSHQRCRSAENVNQSESRMMTNTPDILSDLTRHKADDGMSQVISQLTDVFNQRNNVTNINQRNNSNNTGVSSLNSGAKSLISGASSLNSGSGSLMEVSRVRRVSSDDDSGEIMTDVQSCLDYIDGLLSTPDMIDIPTAVVSIFSSGHTTHIHHHLFAENRQESNWTS